MQPSSSDPPAGGRRLELCKIERNAALTCDAQKSRPPSRRNAALAPAEGAARVASQGRRDIAVASKDRNDLGRGHGDKRIVINARGQAQSHLSRSVGLALHHLAMPRVSDTSAEATRIKAAQKARLRALREAVEPIQKNAAIRSGVSPEAWNRMEKGDTEVSSIALARFCLSYGMPADWVILGALAGLPPALQRAFVSELPALIAGAEPDTDSEPASQPPGGTGQGRKAHKRTEYSR